MSLGPDVLDFRQEYAGINTFERFFKKVSDFVMGEISVDKGRTKCLGERTIARGPTVHTPDSSRLIRKRKFLNVKNCFLIVGNI